MKKLPTTYFKQDKCPMESVALEILARIRTYVRTYNKGLLLDWTTGFRHWPPERSRSFQTVSIMGRGQDRVAY